MRDDDDFFSCWVASKCSVFIVLTVCILNLKEEPDVVLSGEVVWKKKGRENLFVVVAAMCRSENKTTSSARRREKTRTRARAKCACVCVCISLICQRCGDSRFKEQRNLRDYALCEWEDKEKKKSLRACCCFFFPSSSPLSFFFIIVVVRGELSFRFFACVDSKVVGADGKREGGLYFSPPKKKRRGKDVNTVIHLLL